MPLRVWLHADDLSVHFCTVPDLDAVPGNIGQLRTFRQRINRLWRNVLVRRSQRAKKKWESLTPVFDRWVPIPRILHPYPHARFNATHP